MPRLCCLIYTARHIIRNKMIGIANALTGSRGTEADGDLFDGVRFITDIEGGNVHNVRKISENRFSVQMKPDEPSDFAYPDHHSYWFYFRIEGVKGKKIRIDLTNCHWMRGHWKKYKPVYSYAEDPDKLDGVSWNRIGNTRLRWFTFSFVHEFDRDTAWIALRYPYNYTRLIRYLDSVRGREHIRVEELGGTAGGNSVYMAVITDSDVPDDGKRGVLVYAREHGVEQDGSWVAEGMIDFLTSSDPDADRLRRGFIFMIIPIVSPDSAVSGRAMDPVTGKCVGGELSRNKMDSIEAVLLHSRMQRFVDNGGSLDLCISFHNPHGTEPNLYPTYRPASDKTRLEMGKALHRSILKHAGSYTVWKEFNFMSCNHSIGRFAKDFGSVAILYEVNHQAKDNYLPLKQLKGMGEVFLKGIMDYYH